MFPLLLMGTLSLLTSKTGGMVVDHILVEVFGLADVLRVAFLSPVGGRWSVLRTRHKDCAPASVVEGIIAVNFHVSVPYTKRDEKHCCRGSSKHYYRH